MVREDWRVGRATIDGRIIGDGAPLWFLLGPCVIESEDLVFQVARFVRDIGAEFKCPVVFKASYDKANRSSGKSFRGPGLAEGLKILSAVKREFGIPVTTDIHQPHEAESAASVADLLQIPAFLCRQTDLLIAAAATTRPVNVKKGQFMAPEEMANVVEKLQSAGATSILLTERGTCFGYHNLVVDFRGIAIMRSLGVPVIFDITHSLQSPGGRGTASGGDRRFARPLARAAAAVGVDGIFAEIHPRPESALSDPDTQIPLSEVRALISEILQIDSARRRVPG
ncbi:MAG: 3-deoxy-8-phosphooctulonate synthase [bacterium JZ-2024 1]